jgi:hypothetical protein
MESSVVLRVAMPREIAVDEVLAFAVASDGTAFRMSVRGKTGDVVGLAFPTDAVKTLMMGLSQVADEALTRMLRDDSARLIHPVESFSLQPAPGTDQLILGIRTHDGLEAAFCNRAGGTRAYRSKRQ